MVVDDPVESPAFQPEAMDSDLSLQTPYVHHLLPDDSTWIRLLELQPASDHNAPIQGRLQIARLEAAYEALSYCWGDPIITEPMYLDGRSFAVTTNLAEALRTLRFADRIRTMWVDAICINQTDILEKNHQVAIMRDIYAGSSCTNVWLGPSDEHSRKKFKQMCRKEVDWNHITWEGVCYMRAGRPRKAIVDRPWMSRVWVVQEIAASRTITVHCGSDQCSWDEFEDVWGAIGVSQWHDQRSTEQIYAFTAIKWAYAHGGRLNLHMALRYLHTFDATRAVDKVYAVLGLLHEPADVAIDYRIDPRDLFRDVALKIVMQTSSLNVILNALQDEQGPKLSGLMSWIPDWTSKSFSLIPSIQDTDKRYDWEASPTYLDCWPVLHPDNTLGVKAQFIAQVDEVAQPFPDFAQILTEAWPLDKAMPQYLAQYRSLKLLLDAIKSWSAVALKIDDTLRSRSDVYITGQPLAEAAYYTIAMAYPPATYDQSWQVENAIDVLDRIRQLSIWARKYITPLPLPLALLVAGPIMLPLIVLLSAIYYIRGVRPQHLRWIYEHMFPSNTQVLRPLGRTTNGLLGLFPGPDIWSRHNLLTRPGDSIVLLQGAAMPLVIRKAGSHWRVVGEAYIHGIMFGAAFKRDQCIDITLC